MSSSSNSSKFLLEFLNLIAELKPALNASLDPIAVVDSKNKILYANLSMKSFLGLNVRQLRERPVFCECIRLNGCENKKTNSEHKTCQIIQAIEEAEVLQLDQTPAQVKNEKLRIQLKVTPIFPSKNSKIVKDEDRAKALGAIITLRDLSPEMVLQAKYARVLEMLDNYAIKVDRLEIKVAELQATLMRARQRAI